MAAEIKVGVGADISGLEKGLAQGEKGVKAFSKSVEKLDLDKGLTKGANQAGNALVNLGRVAQDAPFGFVGIQNNINPLLESFQRLKTETGSTGGALKALGQSMIGPAGLGVAVSVLTAGITVLSQHPEILTNLFSSLTDTTKGLTKAQQEYNDSLAESVSSVQGEVANIHSLVNIAKDENQSRSTRLQAVKELNKNYPELNNQIKLEGINSKETTKLINNLTDALILRAKVQAVQGLIGDAFKKQIESQNSALQTQASTFSKIKAVFQLALPVQGAFMANSTLIASGAEEQDAALKDSQKTLSDYQKILDGLNSKLGETGNLFKKPPASIKKAFEKINITDLPKIQSLGADIADSLSKGLKSNEAKVGETLANILSLNPALFAKITKQLSDNLQEIPIGVKAPELGVGGLNDMLSGIMSGSSNVLDTSGMNVPGLDTSNLDKVNSKIQNLKAGYKNAVADLNAQNKVLKEGFQSAFEGIGEAIGSAFASGEDPLKALGVAILGTLGDVLVQFGKLTITAGIAATALAHALTNPLDPGAGAVAIAAGIALVAIGSAVKSFSGGLAKGGSGGSARGGSFSPSVPSGFSPTAPGGQAATPRSDVITVQGILKGQDILLSSKRTEALNFRTG